MFYLEIIILLMSATGAVYGIWSKAPVNLAVAGTTTAITLLGLTGSLLMSIWKSRDAAERSRLEAERAATAIQAAFAGNRLVDLQLSWRFTNVPSQIVDVVQAGQMIADTNFFPDDELSRLPAEQTSILRRGWFLDSGMTPLLVEIAGTDTAPLYGGESIADAAARYGSREWVEGMGSSLRYDGPVYTTLLPLNLTSDAVLALGKRSDDHIEVPVDENEGYGFLKELAKAGDHAFQASATTSVDDDGTTSLALDWSYGLDSLDRAVARKPSATMSAAFPRSFSLVIAQADIDRSHYSDLLKYDPRNGRSTPDGQWDKESTLEIFVNGLRDPHYIYEVTKQGVYEYAPDMGAYDAPEVEYMYTIFNCTLQRLSYSPV